MNNELKIYKSIILFLAKNPSEQISFWCDLPHDVGVFNVSKIETTSLWQVIRASEYYFNHTFTYGDSDEDTEEIEHYLDWVLHTAISSCEDSDWTAQGIKKSDTWGLARKLAREIIDKKNWQGDEVVYSSQQLLAYSDLYE